MNDMERTLFIKGLENLYGSVLMGDDQALEQIERLVCLARELDDPGAAVQPMAQEFAWIHRYVEACWPESRFTIHGEGTDYAWQVPRGYLSRPVCQALAQADRQGRLPDELTVWRTGESIHFRLSCKGQVCAQGCTDHA